MRINSFSTSDKRFFASSLRYIKDENISNLILDLRGNTGGNRNVAISLGKHLVDTIFAYSILQPKLNTKAYVNGKGKRFLLLSKLKYNIGNFFKGHRTEFGREFVYRFKPNREVYKGKLFVITDGLTASSSTMLTSWLKQHTDAQFIGKQAGGGYNGNNGGSFPVLTLPESKIEITFPAYRLILDHASRTNQGIIPDIEPRYTITDIVQNRDVEMETIIKLLKEKN